MLIWGHKRQKRGPQNLRIVIHHPDCNQNVWFLAPLKCSYPLSFSKKSVFFLTSKFGVRVDIYFVSSTGKSLYQRLIICRHVWMLWNLYRYKGLKIFGCVDIKLFPRSTKCRHMWFLGISDCNLVKSVMTKKQFIQVSRQQFLGPSGRDDDPYCCLLQDLYETVKRSNLVPIWLVP